MGIKDNKIYKSLRAPLVKLRIYKSFFYDANRYIKHSNSLKKDKNPSKLVATIIKAYHVVEKGLTMPEMRQGFGQDKLVYLIDRCNEYFEHYDDKNSNVKNAVKVIFEYYTKHQKLNVQLNDDLLNLILDLKQKYGYLTDSEQELITPSLVSGLDTLTFKDFAFTRSSIRNYSTKEIKNDIINKAVEIAQNSPSACNRQPSRVHVFSEKKDIEGILNLQNGNKGFGHLANKIIVLTTDLNGYHTQMERYMNWIDGGIYLMNLIYSLQYFKIGTCILNWGVEKTNDTALRKLGNIGDNESIIAVISCGHYLEDEFQVAKSPKRPISEVLTFH